MDVTIYHKNEVNTHLNINLVRGMTLSQKEVDEIRSLHKLRLIVEDRLEEVVDKDTIELLMRFWRKIQFDLQKAWGFPEDSRFHREYDIPCCKCPKMDNDDLIGTDVRVYNKDCKLHGQFDI